MNTEEFAKKVTDKFCTEITDLLFLYIENDRELMSDYLHLVSENRLLNVNADLGLKFKDIFNLENGNRCETPKSKLISSYTEHCF